ncbi:LysR substrate-binding domain-containing protein [Orrella sp. JC864]|uniref:LysR substrate-binding domain-containing protein n=1 Tax=Orrella sp. JC864 TaxID=3120298 RepID=UPI0012BCCB6A
MSKLELMRLEGKLLHAFSVVAEELHFGRAAERLRISQPPLSKQIMRLEEQLGAALLIRTTRSVRLTPAGRIVHAYARRLADDLQGMLRAVEQVSHGLAGNVTIGLAPSAARSSLTVALHQFKEGHPDFAVELREMNSLEMADALRARRIDLALMRPIVVEADIRTHVVHEEPMLLAVRLDHPLANQRRATLEQVAQYPLIGYDARISPYFRTQLQTMFLKASVRPHIVQESVVPTLLALVEIGVGIALVPESIAQSRNGVLRFVPLAAEQASHVHIIAATLRHGENSARDSCLRILRRFAREAGGR